MNTEELEQSLRTEFESYFKSFLADMRKESAEFQGSIQAEFEKQRSQFDETFRDFTARFDSERTFDAAFSSTIGEHLRLARDEGARIAADAMVEAENLGQSPMVAVPVPIQTATKYDIIRDAVSDISSKDSQSTILKALVHHAAEFAPRGGFFIIKAAHFSGWKVFGASDAAENAIRDIHFPVSGDTILGAAVEAKATVDNSGGNHLGNAAFTNPLQFGEPDRMYAIPLVARGRGVAVLYVDYGSEPDLDSAINREALETIVRVAGLTVELIASMQTAKAENRTMAPADFEDVGTQSEEVFSETEAADTNFVEPQHPSFDSEVQAQAPNDFVPEIPEPVSEETVAKFDDTVRDLPVTFGHEPVDEPVAEEREFSFNDSVSFEGGLPSESVAPNPFDAEPVAEQFGSVSEDIVSPPVSIPAFDDSPFAEPPYIGDEAQRLADAARAEALVETFEPVTAVEREVESFQPVPSFESAPEMDREVTSGALIFDTGSSLDPAPVVSSPFDQPSVSYEPAAVVSGGGFGQQVAEPVLEAPVVTAPQPRLRDRNVDLPIEVPEDERRIHNDARRFARLLVSEIKLYNEKKVVEGREANDLYDRLREAIDRSREMYDKRVQPPVAAKFDYFHYEIVNSLADGSAERLGNGYPGASV